MVDYSEDFLERVVDFNFSGLDIALLRFSWTFTSTTISNISGQLAGLPAAPSLDLMTYVGPSGPVPLVPVQPAAAAYRLWTAQPQRTQKTVVIPGPPGPVIIDGGAWLINFGVGVTTSKIIFSGGMSNAGRTWANLGPNVNPVEIISAGSVGLSGPVTKRQAVDAYFATFWTPYYGPPSTELYNAGLAFTIAVYPDGVYPAPSPSAAAFGYTWHLGPPGPPTNSIEQRGYALFFLSIAKLKALDLPTSKALAFSVTPDTGCTLEVQAFRSPPSLPYNTSTNNPTVNGWSPLVVSGSAMVNYSINYKTLVTSGG